MEKQANRQVLRQRDVDPDDREDEALGQSAEAIGSSDGGDRFNR